MALTPFVMPDTDEDVVIDTRTQKGRAAIGDAIDAAIAHRANPGQGGSTMKEVRPREAKHKRRVEHGGCSVPIR